MGKKPQIVSYVDKIPGKYGMFVELVIQVNQNTINRWNKFMDEVNTSFRQTLWIDQKKNQAVREYLKLNPCMGMFC